ncbi:MAG TPA: hypothetical protein VGR89_17075 [Puia sp.]|nr:hypothetical protein [Puia sp.]
MKNPFEQLPASQLRRLLIEQVKSFATNLDKGYSSELEDQRKQLICILHQLSEKEKLE